MVAPRSEEKGKEINMSAKVNGLGHVGFYVQDIDLMKDFYANFMGMTLTKVGPLGAFFSSDPEAVDHEIALVNGRTSLEDPHWIQQISMRVDSLDDLRDFKRRIHEHGYQLDRIVTHASAIGCYFRDPEGNPTEVFWLTGHTSWAHIGVPINIDQSDEVVMAEVLRSWETVQGVEMGKPTSPETINAIRELNATAAATR
jgi:catechol-2,3-dioxygenase